MRLSIVLFLSSSLPLPLAAQDPREAQQIAPYSLSAATEISLASAADNAVVVFQNRNYPANMGIYATRSDGRGIEWSDPVRLDSGPVNADRTQPVVALTGDRGIAAWRDDQLTGSDDHDVWFSHTTDGGRSWSSAQAFPKAGFPAGYPHEVHHFQAAASQGRLYLGQMIRQADRTGQLWLMGSTDGGATWSAGTRINENHPVPDDNWSMATEGDLVAVAWMRRNGAPLELWFRKSEDGGQTWSAESLVHSSNSGTSIAQSIHLGLDGDQVAIGWEASSLSMQRTVNTIVSEDRGATWVRPTSLDPGNTPAHSTLAMGNGLLAVGWRRIDRYPLPTESWIACSSDLGRTWHHQEFATNAYPPQPATGDGYLAAAWGHTTTSSVGMAVSLDGGESWLPSRFLTPPNGPREAHTPSLVWNQRYRNFVSAWIGRDAGVAFQYLPYAGGLRAQTLKAFGYLRPGGRLRFELEHAREADAGGAFVVLLAWNPGHSYLPGQAQLDLGLAPDALFWRSLRALPGPLSGEIDASGSGRTAYFTIPNSLPTGTVFHAVGVLGRTCGGYRLGSITDVLTLTLG